MIHVYYRGMGTQYVSRMKEIEKTIQRKHPLNLSNQRPAKPGFKVAIHQEGARISRDIIKGCLNHENVTFIIGDSKGIPDDIIESADCVVSISNIAISHALQALIIMEELERILVKKE